jgi:hypothetical protein
MSVTERFQTKTVFKRSETFMKRLRTFEIERSNALERIVVNVYVSKLKDQLCKKESTFAKDLARFRQD